MQRARFRFYGALNDFLPAERRKTDASYTFWGRPAVKDAIEAQGIPHPEVDLILVDTRPVRFGYTLQDGDRVSVYPTSRQAGVPDGALRPPRPEPPRFVCDVHLGRLARSLRMLGLDVRYQNDADDPALAEVADAETRILLTRDIELLKRSRVTHGAFVRAEDPDRQFAEMVVRFNLGDYADPLTRCLRCNDPLQPVAKENVVDDLPAKVRRLYDQFYRCPECDQVYWNGSHVDQMRQTIQRVLDRSRQARR